MSTSDGDDPATTPEGWSAAELLREVLELPRFPSVRMPDTEVTQGPGWLQLLTPSFRQGGLNEVSYSVLGAEEADAVIASTIAQYRARGLRFRWAVVPGSRPEDLAERLRAHGLRYGEVRGMYRVLRDEPGPADDAVTVEAVDERNLPVYAAVLSQGWGVDPVPFEAFSRLQLREAPARYRLFLARCDGEPAGVASYVAFARSAHLVGGVVRRELRGRGVYRALVAARLADATARGISLATSHAKEQTSAPILVRLGFETCCRFPVFTSA